MFTYGANPLPSFFHESLPPLKLFLKIPKNKRLQLGPNPVPICGKFEPHSSALTIRSSHHAIYYNLSVRIRSTDSGLREISFFFPMQLPFVFQNRNREGRTFESGAIIFQKAAGTLRFAQIPRREAHKYPLGELQREAFSFSFLIR